MKLSIVIVLIYITLPKCEVQQQHQRTRGMTARRPAMYGDRIPLNALNPAFNRVAKKIVLYHNFFRSRVKPTASNMLRMSWHIGAARLAQSWASKCHFLQHDPKEDRQVPVIGACGQNIFISSQQVPWFFAIKNWFLEKDIYEYGSRNNSLHAVGHYTQMVWATSRRVGCGIARCVNSNNDTKAAREFNSVFYNYVCNYCPTGNWRGKLGTPYIAGKQCAKCPNKCHEGLCSNPCLVQDRWSNCNYLLRIEGPRACRPGSWIVRNCLASCHCKNKIHEWRT